MTLSHLDTAKVCRALALLIHAGIGPADGAFLLAREEQAPLQNKLEEMGRELDAGHTLSQAMKHSDIFPEYVWRMVGIGEQTGRQEESLNLLGDYYEEQYRVSRRIRSAVTYPGMVLLLMLLVLGVLLVKVVPVFDRVYASLGSRLTGPAAGLLYLGQGLQQLLPALFLLLLVLAAAVLAVRFCPGIRKRADRFRQLRFGDRGIGRKFSNARFARAMAMGLGSGLTLDESMLLAQNLLQDSPGAARRCDACIQAMNQGAAFREAVEAADLLPPAQCRMLSLGIQGGNADQVMDSIAQTLLEDAQNALEDAISRIEPAMVLVCTLLVGLILLAVMLPLMDVLSALG